MAKKESDVLASLDEAQLSAVQHLRGPLCILAGAGTGKTRVVTHRIAYGIQEGIYSPNRVMALTFTAKAAGELRSRLRELSAPLVSARTFHATALAQINFFWPQIARQEPPKVIKAKADLLTDAAAKLSLRLAPQQLREVAGLIEWRKVKMLSAEKAVNERGAEFAYLRESQLFALLNGYESIKSERNAMDFEDVLLACAGMLEHEGHILAQVREQYRHFTVDEFQDVSPLQFHLLQLWLGHRTDLAVVGDPQQTIYEFSGASSSYLNHFEHYFPGAKVVELEKNYRSDPLVVQAAESVFNNSKSALQVPIQINEFADEYAESEAVAQQILASIATGVPLGEIAVLYRNQAQAQQLRKALNEAGLPVQVLGQQKFFEIPEVQRAVRVLRADAAAASTHQNYLDQVREVLGSLGYSDEKPHSDFESLRSWLYLDVLMGLARGRLRSKNYREFSDRLLQLVADNYEPRLDVVTLSTIHAAKGLEWDHVWLIGVNEGLLPTVFAKDTAQVAQEQRLLYVGITRAKSSIVLSWCASVNGRPALSSRFLKSLDSSKQDEAGRN